jgi:hypothetical protein
MTAPADNTPASIIADAYFDAGIIQEGDSPNSEQIASSMRRLTDLINFEQTQGVKLWLNVDTAIPLVSGQGTYVLSPTGDVVMPKPPRAIQGYYIDSSSIRRPLTVLSWDDYIRLSQITETGAINSFFVNKKATELSVFFWLIPDATAATGVAHLLLQTQVTNFISCTETMNFPAEWRIFLHWALADELSTGQPQAIMDRCQQRAERYREALENWDVEDAPTRFTPDTQQRQGFGSFR